MLKQLNGWKCLILALLLSARLCVLAQNPGSTITTGDIHLDYLEHLVKTGIDSVREAHGYQALYNDSVLYLAARHHAEYMTNKKLLSHFENDVPAYKTPQLRAQQFGARNYSVGENVMKTNYNVDIEHKKGIVINTNTYAGLARSIVVSWVQSPPHFANMLTSDYQITGLSIAIDEEKQMVYACQKFAVVKYRYTFDEPVQMFPFSTMPKIESVSSHSPSELNTKHRHEWKLHHKNKGGCTSCLEQVEKTVQLTLYQKNAHFVLKVENSDYVKSLMTGKHDGFAIEIVGIDDYMCGNPAYYTNESRRNGACMLNGKLLKPMYRDQLMKGYKKRKRIPSVRYLPFVFNADSVPFFRRFANYKAYRYSSEYFEIKLARIPRELPEYYEYNLVYIQNREICYIQYLHSYCSTLYADYRLPEPIVPELQHKVLFAPERKELQFRIPFAKDQSSFTAKDIGPFKQAIKQLDYTIDSVRITAYSSVEGDTGRNKELQTARALAIANLLKVKHEDSLSVQIQTESNHIHFNERIAHHPRWRFLTDLDSTERMKQINQTYAEELEPLLKQGRYADIVLNYTIDLTAQNQLWYYQHYFELYNDSLKEADIPHAKTFHYLDQLGKLYAMTFDQILHQEADSSLLLKLEIPKSFTMDSRFSQYRYMTYARYPYMFKEQGIGDAELIQLRKHILKAFPKSLEPAFVLSLALEQTQHLTEQKQVSQEQVQQIITSLKALAKEYRKDSMYRMKIDSLNYSLNMLLLNKVFIENPGAHKQDALKALQQVKRHLEVFQEWDEEWCLKLARTAVYYNNQLFAEQLLLESLHHPDVLGYYLSMGYRHPSMSSSDVFYENLIRLSEELPAETWCELFLGTCKIPFQSFDHELLRTLFCDKCMDKNTTMKALRN